MADSPTLNDEFSYMGFWWLPEDPDMRWAGAITYEPESGITLDLINDWKFEFKFQGRDTFEFSHPSPPEYRERFLGIASQSPHHISLLGNHRIIASVGASVIHRRYRPEYLLVGHDFCSPKGITLQSTLNSAVVTYSSLRGWMWQDSPFDRKIEGRDITLSYKLGRKLLEFDNPAIESKVLFYEGIRDSPGGSGHEITRHSSVEIKPGSPQTLDWFCEQIDSIRDLLAFLAGIPVESKRIRVGLDEDVSKTGRVNIYRNVRLVNWDEDSNRNMAFPLARLGESTATVFQKWFSLSEEEQVPFKLCLDVINNTHRFWQFEFLALVHALESHYQVTHPQENRPSLRKCLTCLRRDLPIEIRSKLDFDHKFQKRIIDTRNYYSHYNPNNREGAYREFDLHFAILRMLPLAATVLYRELGIPDDKILSLIQRVKHYELALWQRGELRPLTRLQDDE